MTAPAAPPAASAFAPPPHLSAERAAAGHAFVRGQLGEHVDLARASTDAGFRSYWRARRADGGSVILMDAPPGLEDVGPWLALRAHLEAHGVRVPRVLAEDRPAGFLLLEDLGHDTLLHVLPAEGEDDAAADAWIDRALDQLLRIQAAPPPPGLPRYDEDLLLRELRLFDAWFLERELGIALDCALDDRLALAYRRLIDAALAQPQVLVHRDFMPRNLMPLPGEGDGLAVLDFQDAVLGPIAYDPLSLVKDAFHGWSDARARAWLARYHARAAAAGLPVPPLERFLWDADLIGIQRHLKVLGIFARLKHRDGKPRYVADAVRFLGYLEDVLPRHPALADLAWVIRERVRPVFDARAAAAAGA